MKLDLRKDKQKIQSYVGKRIRDYPTYVNCGPGNDDDPIKMVVLAFEATQSGSIALIFDTRPDADYDGEYTKFLEDYIMLQFPKWPLACDLLEEGETPIIIPADGREAEADDDPCYWIGDMLTDVLLENKENGNWSKLPLAKNAFMMVIEFDENYLWPNYRSRKTVGRIVESRK